MRVKSKVTSTGPGVSPLPTFMFVCRRSNVSSTHIHIVGLTCCIYSRQSRICGLGFYWRPDSIQSKPAHRRIRSMATTGFKPPPQWHWPSDIPDASARAPQDAPQIPGTFKEEYTAIPDGSKAGQHDVKQEPKQEQHFRANPHSRAKPQSSSRKNWPPRTCRICLEVVVPTFSAPSDHLPESLQPAPSVSYISEDPESGRLLRPCRCKGSSKYVHEGCLQSWRHADPNSKRNYWQCPTCGFRYRLERMNWGRWISSNVTQVGLTIAIFIFAMFLLGFVADPIINFYLDPYSAISTDPISKLNTRIDPVLSHDDVPSWAEHFVKGLASLGLLGFVKFLFALGPWQWFNLRSSGIVSGGGRGGTTGRDRLANLSWIMIILGVATFLWVCELPSHGIWHEG